MKIPQLRKKPEIKSCHNVNWEDNYSWVHQPDILEVLKDSIFNTMFNLPEDTIVYCGHGTETTIKQEKLTNYILQY